MKKSYLFLLLIALLLISCEAFKYKPTETSFTTVEPGISDSVSISLNNFGDTIVVDNNFSLYFNTDREIESMELFVDGESWGTITDYFYFGIQFNITSLEDGYYDLRFDLQVTPGNGSLMDNLELEFTQYVMHKTLFIDRSEASPIELESVEWLEDGSGAELTWQPNTDTSFRYYVIHKYSHLFNSTTDDTIWVQTQGSYIDNYDEMIYGEEIASYQIKVYRLFDYAQSGYKYLNSNNVMPVLGGTRLILSNEDRNEIYVNVGSELTAFSTQTNQVLRSCPAPNVGTDFVITNDLSRIYMLRNTADQMRIIDLPTFNELDEIDFEIITYPMQPEGPIIDMGNSILHRFNTVPYRKNLSTGVQTHLGIGGGVKRMCVSSDNHYLYTITQTSNRYNYHLHRYELINEEPVLLNSVEVSDLEVFGSLRYNEELQKLIYCDIRNIQFIDPITLAIDRTIEVEGMYTAIFDYKIYGSKVVIAHSYKIEESSNDSNSKIIVYDMDTDMITEEYLFSEVAQEVAYVSDPPTIYTVTSSVTYATFDSKFYFLRLDEEI